eukprot:1195441-Prorocentrum_minimum.AAC.2
MEGEERAAYILAFVQGLVDESVGGGGVEEDADLMEAGLDSLSFVDLRCGPSCSPETKTLKL